MVLKVKIIKYWREPIKIHLQDAQSRGLINGDIVDTFNKKGKCLAGVIISNEVMKGVVFLPLRGMIQ